MTAYNLHEFWDSGRTGSGTCIDADGSLVLGLMNLVDTRLNDSGEWTPTGVTVDTTNPADELVTNGTFDADVSGWAGLNGSISWSAGTLLLTEDGADSSAARAYQTITTVVGQTYRLSADVVSVSTGAALIAASTSPAYGGQPQVGSLVSGDTGVLQFTATSTTTYILLVASGTSPRTATFDNVSVLPVISSGTDSAGEKRYLLTEDTSTGVHSVSQTFAAVSGKTYTIDVRVKLAAGVRDFGIALSSGIFGTGNDWVFDLENLEAPYAGAGTNASSSIKSLGDGEYLCRLTADATSSGNPAVTMKIRAAGGGSSYTGDGTSGMYVSQATVYESSVGPRAELVVDGDFASGGTTHWTADEGASLAVVSGQLEVTVTSPDNIAMARQTIENLVVGNTYRFSATKVSQDGNSAWRIDTSMYGLNDGGVSFSSSATGTFSEEFIATAETMYVQLWAGNGGATGVTVYDNVSVLPVTPQMQKSSKDNSYFMENETGAPKYALRVDHSNGVPEVLAEPAGTNEIRNSTMQGASVGLLSAGGSLPTNWTVSRLTTSEVEVVALGEEDGLSYIDIRLNGTPTGSVVVTFEGNATSPAAVQNDVWTHSFYVKRVGGDETNIINIENRITELNSSRAFLAKHDPAFTLTTDRQRIVNTNTLTDPSVAYTNSAIELGNTGAIDITIRLYAPQLEQSHVATSFIPTTTAAATRVKDEPSRGLPEGFIQGEGSIYFEGSIDYKEGGSGFPRVVQIDDGTNNNRVNVGCSQAAGNITFFVATGSVQQASFVKGVSPGQSVKIVARYNDADFAVSFDGDSTQTDTSGTPSSNMTTIRIGDTTGVIDTVRIRDFRLFPYSSPAATPGWSNDTLEEISGA